MSASGADLIFASNEAILAFKISLLTFTSAFSAVFGVSAPTLVATADATDSLVFSTVAAFSTAFGASSLTAAFVVLSTVVLLEISSLACATAPAPKKMLAPITTDAAPTLNFLIE